MRSPSPSPSITSLSSRGATGLAHQPAAHQPTLFQPHQSSLQQAAYIYSAKLTPPTSMAGVAGQQAQQKRPSSARDYNGGSVNGSQSGRPISASSSRAGLQSGSLHYQTAANEEAIADALQKLAERQAARQYSATSQLQALTQHLSSINLANMSAARQHHIGQHQHTIGSQRASSLSDLASGDPSIQSMIDPSSWETESSRAAAAKASQSGGGQQALAQQSKELLQQSRAKHQAMVAQAHNAVTHSAAAKLPTEEASSNTYRTPLLASQGYAADSSSSRPPQVPRPPERPKPVEKQPPIRKPLGGNKITRIGSHPQLTGLSPNPSSLTLADDNYSMNFYNNLKYDASTGSTKIVDASDGYRMNGIAAESGSRPSSAKRPTWKP